MTRHEERKLEQIIDSLYRLAAEVQPDSEKQAIFDALEPLVALLTKSVRTRQGVSADDLATINAEGFHEAMMERPQDCPYDNINDVRREAWIAGYRRGIQLMYNYKEND